MNAKVWTRTLMGLALVGLMACGGAETEEAPEAEAAPEAPAAPAMPEAQVVEGTELANAAAHEGMTVRVNGLQVNSAVGTSAVFVTLPTTRQPTPFLIHFSQPPIPAARGAEDPRSRGPAAAVRRYRPEIQRPAGRIYTHPEARSSLGRRRRHGADRARGLKSSN